MQKSVEILSKNFVIVTPAAQNGGDKSKKKIKLSSV